MCTWCCPSTNRWSNLGLPLYTWPQWEDEIIFILFSLLCQQYNESLHLNDLLKDLGVELGAILGLDKQVGARDLLSGVQLVRLSKVDKFNA